MKTVKWQELPPALFYPLLFPHVLKLCLKYRVPLSIIEKSNPCFTYGGLPFNSKYEMMNVFESHMNLRYELIDVEWSLSKKLLVANELIEKTGYPIFIKPDTGHRGLDVQKIDNEAQLVDVLENAGWDYIIQEYCGFDEEFGIFYYRYPGQEKGNVYSITNKVIPIVLGDGEHTVAELIKQQQFKNEEHYFSVLRDYDLMYVPKAGEKFRTMPTAAHCYGAAYNDASHLITPELVDKMNEICRDKEYYFGRMDVKAESIAAFKKGEFKIIEINGATSEFGHPFDDKYSLKEGLGFYKAQWDMLFKISHGNRDKGDQRGFWDFLMQYTQFFLNSKKVTGKFW